MDLEIRPLQGVGTIDFGMSPAEVRAQIGGEFRTFNRSPASVYPCDFFQNEGVFAHYDAAGTLQALEFATPAQPRFFGVNFLSMPLSSIAEILESHQANPEFDIDGVIAREVGISIYAPLSKENLLAPCESVLVFEAGYYD